MASKYHDDWQSSKKTVLERNTYMFDNELMSDVSFTCGESSRIFHAHKYVLATSSAVFYAMFYGDLAQQESTVRIPDADEESFKELLRFLYTGPYTGFFNWGGSGLSLGGMVRQFQWVQGGMVRQFQCPGGAPAPPAPPLCTALSLH